jgi:pimeloyl-ACP methyl ester carboxylesterase
VADAGWSVARSGPDRGAPTVLLLPGLFGTAVFYQDLQAEPRLAADTTLAATPPGFGGLPTPAQFDFGVESYAALVEAFVREEGVDVLVAHSFFANVAIEIAARGSFAGRLLLLSPCLRRVNEEADLRRLERASRLPVVRSLVWALVYAGMKSSMKDRLPASRLDALVAEMRRNSARADRRLLLGYFAHLDRYGNLVDRLIGSGREAWVVRGDRDEIGLLPEDRDRLEAASNIELRNIPDAAHFAFVEQPQAVAAVIGEFLTGAPG